MKNKEIVSAVLGGAFFAIPYIGLTLPILPALVLGAGAFTASELVLSSIKPKSSLKNNDRPLYIKITQAKTQNKEIINMIPKIDNTITRKSLKEINDSVTKIIDTFEKSPKKANKQNNFFDYYLPVLLKIIKRYDEIENQKLISKDGKNFIEKANKMIEEINQAFKLMLSKLYQNDIVDMDAEMKVYNLMLKSDGIVEDDIMKERS